MPRLPSFTKGDPPNYEDPQNYINYPDWSEWNRSALTQESQEAPIGFAPMPDAPKKVGRLISNRTSGVKVQLGNEKSQVTGTANMHPYYFTFTTSGKCDQFARKRTCNKARGCSWRGNQCTFAGWQSPGPLGFNDIALVVLDEAQPDAEKMTLSDSGDVTVRSALIGRGHTIPSKGGPVVEVGGTIYQSFWEGFCAKLNGNAARTSPVRFLPNYEPFTSQPRWSEMEGVEYTNTIPLPKRSKRLFKKWCTPTDPSYLDPRPVEFGIGQPKWTDFLERSTPQACEEWYGKYITEDNWDANGDIVPVIPTKDAAFDAVVCSAQTRPLFRESNRVPNGDCQGDSGGPIVEGTLNSLGAQYGVVSFGGPRAYKKKSRLSPRAVCGGLQYVCRCGGKVVSCSTTCPKEINVGWRHVDQSQNVYAKVSHFKEWLKQQESVCGKMRWSSDV
jgi:hypothetical protein